VKTVLGLIATVGLGAVLGVSVVLAGASGLSEQPPAATNAGSSVEVLQYGSR
jgi:hypothetical protein